MVSAGRRSLFAHGFDLASQQQPLDDSLESWYNLTTEWGGRRPNFRSMRRTIWESKIQTTPSKPATQQAPQIRHRRCDQLLVWTHAHMFCTMDSMIKEETSVSRFCRVRSSAVASNAGFLVFQLSCECVFSVFLRLQLNSPKSSAFDLWHLWLTIVWNLILQFNDDDLKHGRTWRIDHSGHSRRAGRRA